MYKKIIVCLALDHGIGHAAIDKARNIRTEGGEIIAVHVYEPPNSSVKTFLTEDDATKAYKSAKDRLAERIGDAPTLNR